MKTTHISPQTHIFLWDLHDVILQKSLWSWFLSCIRFKRKREVIRHLNTKAIKIAFTFLLERLKLTKKQMVSEELIKAAQTTNNDALVELTMLVCASYYPIKKTVALINELDRLGYTHHLGSNIGQTVYDDCKEKFPTIFNLFKEIVIPFEVESKIIKKPNPHFFRAHLEKHNLQPEQIIFIDDKFANVQTARSLGMHAIHFKNPHQLRKELNALKIFT
jgi:FMN phosphatase YigB (HAD superfamily)